MVAAGRVIFLDVVVDGELDGAGDVGAAIRLDGGAIDDADVRVVGVLGEPFGLGEDFWAGVVHGASGGCLLARSCSA